ncbi:MAG: FtsX-like permease family protein [Gemmatimonadota bacterium]
MVAPGYFEAMRIPLVAGRAPRPDGPAAVPNPVLVSSALARRLAPDGTVVGRRVRRADADGERSTIVGVTADVPRRHVAGETLEAVYVPILDRPAYAGRVPRRMTLVVRADIPPTSLVPSVRRIVRELRPDLPLVAVRTMDRVVADSMTRTSFTMALLLVAAASALLLGGVGLYGVVSYTVGRRTREIGLRVALGARTADVRRMVVREGAAVAAIGLALGAPAALLLSRLLDSLLFEVSPTDPFTLVLTAALLFGVALLASDLPARRAARLDPVTALRAE